MIPRQQFTLQWHLTEKCNLHCIHCYQNDKYIVDELSINMKKKIADEILKAFKIWNVKGRIYLTGGEPFINYEELVDIILYMRFKNFDGEIGILTNGTLINDENIKKIRNLVDVIQVSLDGANEETHDKIRGKGTFKLALDAIKVIKNNGIQTAVMCTIHKKNISEIPKLISLCLKLKVDRLGVERVVPEGKGKNLSENICSSKEIHKIYRYLAKMSIKYAHKIRISTQRPLWGLLREEGFENLGGGCSAGYSGLTIMPNGDVMPCRRMDMVIGNLTKESLFDIWYSSKMLWKLRDRKRTFKACKDCKHLEYCGGCRAVAKAVTGDIFAKDPQCWR